MLSVTRQQAFICCSFRMIAAAEPSAICSKSHGFTPRLLDEDFPRLQEIILCSLRQFYKKDLFFDTFVLSE